MQKIKNKKILKISIGIFIGIFIGIALLNRVPSDSSIYEIQTASKKYTPDGGQTVNITYTMEDVTSENEMSDKTFTEKFVYSNDQVQCYKDNISTNCNDLVYYESVVKELDNNIKNN